MKIVLGALAFVASALTISPAYASVIYTFSDPGFTPPPSFTYVAPSFITSPVTIDATALASCGAFLSTCVSVDFAPNTLVSGTSVDELSFNGAFLGRFPFTDTQDFQLGAFTTPGSYTSASGTATLVVSAVPLPESAPLLGAALLVLGAFGYGMKQRKAA